MTTLLKLALCAATVLCITATAIAATSPPAGYATVAQATQAMNHHPATTDFWFVMKDSSRTPDRFWSSQYLINTARCGGFGTAKAGPVYPAFKCNVAWTNQSDSSKAVTTSSFFVRLSPGASCASTRSLADCPPTLIGKPLPGDPRVGCGAGAGLCMTKQAAELVDKALRDAHRIGVNRYCLSQSAFVVGCYSSDVLVGTVSFIHGKTAWTTTVKMV